MILAPLLVLSGEITTGALQGPGTGSLIGYIVAAALGGSLFSYLAQLLIRRQTKDKLISEAANVVAEGARDLLVEYRVELKDARAEVRELRDRIVRLEARLQTATEERAQLQQQLQEAVERRVKAEAAIDELQHRIGQLEGTVERREVRRPPDEPTSQ